MRCKCNTGACTSKTCSCHNKKEECTKLCHQPAGLIGSTCCNHPIGQRVRAMKAPLLRQAIIDANLSIIGDKSELVSRYVDHLLQQDQSSKAAKPPENQENQATPKLLEAVISNEDSHTFILSLSGREVTKDSTREQLRKAYLILSAKVHPDKHPHCVKVATEAFQIVLTAYETLCQPEEEKIDESKQRTKKDLWEARSNDNCYETTIKCPRCRMTWGLPDQGLETAAYNFMMQAFCTYVCCRCFTEFGCMTALHFCPHCKKKFEYDFLDYDNKVICSHCGKSFGFYNYSVSMKRQQEVRREAKAKQEAAQKKIAEKKRRQERASGRKPTSSYTSDSEKLHEQLFLLGLRDTCPRCGWELEKGLSLEDCQQHLDSCSDAAAIANYKKKCREEEERKTKRLKGEELQHEALTYKQWVLNGRQVGQLWMLTDSLLKKECNTLNISTEGKRTELISRLVTHLRQKSLKMITASGENGSNKYNYDYTNLADVDDEDLPTNIHTLGTDELRDVCASYNVEYKNTDSKSQLIRKFEKVRFGHTSLMISDGREKRSERAIVKRTEKPKKDSFLSDSDEECIPVRKKKKPKKKVEDSDEDYCP